MCCKPLKCELKKIDWAESVKIKRTFEITKIPLTFADLFEKHYKHLNVDTLSYKTISANKNTVEKRWFVVDVAGKNLARVSSDTAKLVRGKNNPSLTLQENSSNSPSSLEVKLNCNSIDAQ